DYPGELAVVDAAEATALDAEYAGFPGYEVWADLSIDLGEWTTKFDEFIGRRNRSSFESITQALEVALRAAAVDTGAIEGLYQVDSHFTSSVATRKPGWEKLVEDKGTSFQSTFQSHLRAYELAAQLATAATGVTEAWIRVLHKELCGASTTYRVATPAG